ncbi:MFS general substrate transporter [Cadophora sp. DSE1049]|nr:MFS general substrate transporter [Cadophora sp. DSE1049]
MHDLIRDSTIASSIPVENNDEIKEDDGRSNSDFETQSLTDVENQPGLNNNNTNTSPPPASRSQSNNTQTLTKEKTIEPRRINDGVFLVTWYTDDDPENPQNWTFAKKAWVGTVIFFYTFAVYVGSSLYTAGIPDIVRIFGVSEVAASLGLSLYVVGYGIGPLLFSPLSEIPAIGRNPPYIITFIIFVILTVPASLVDNFGGLLVLRFLLGFFGSPCLATGAASYGDFFHPTVLVYCITFWGAGATLGPCLGPLIAGFAVQAENWRWSAWELLWISGPILLVMLVALPETSSDTILLHRAQRLRKLTGRTDLKSDSEIKQAAMNSRQITIDALIKPWEINILDPAVIFTTVYTALVYGIYYSFFESFPLVYVEIYHFNLGELGLAFLSVFVGLFVGCTLYCLFFIYIGDPHMAKVGFWNVPPEYRIQPSLLGTFFIPMGLFIFAWTARHSVHFIASMIGIALSVCGISLVMQSLFIYLPFTYPKYAGSLFAANDFARSMFAAGSIQYARPMFINLGIAGGVSPLGGLTTCCIAGVYGIYISGARLRKRSKFAVVS